MALLQATEAHSDSFSATQAQLTAQWDVRGIDIQTAAFRGQTMVAPSRLGDRVQRVRTLPALFSPGAEGTLAPFKLGPVLGEGGMGVVRAAEQTALEREVAIKGLRADADPITAAPQLLREARVTGALEHPNVVPIYALGRDDNDQPMIVMKRISGTAWHQVLEQADAALRASDAYLREQLGILVQVAKAIHFAHQKGILHRDIKPENVMLGPFGEVYVVDWGIAVSLREGRLKGVPSAAMVSAIEGTPAYMSPEMAAGDGDAIDERSDVYLLGATLHHVLTGEPPHDGNTLMAVLTHAFASEPKRYPPHIPAELVSICHRAMARFNDDRYKSARDFANALAEFLEHHGSIRLAEEAERRFERLRALAQKDAAADRQAITKLFTECRFAFRQALREWGGNEQARRGMRAAIELMIEVELARGAPEAAEVLLHELDAPPPELERRVLSAVDHRRTANERLKVLERDVDYSFGARLRNVLTYAIGILWGIVCIACGLLDRAGMVSIDHVRFALVNFAFLAGGLVTAYATRRTMLANATNRRISMITVTVFATMGALWLLLGRLGLAMPDANVVGAVSAGFLWLTAAFTVDRSWFAMPVAKVAVLAGISLWPEHHFEILGVCSSLGSLATARHTWRRGRARTTSAERTRAGRA